MVEAVRPLRVGLDASAHAVEVHSGF
jgi:hypothetical protein